MNIMGKDDNDFNIIDVIIFLIVALFFGLGLLGFFLSAFCTTNDACTNDEEVILNNLAIILFAILLYKLRTKQNINKPEFVEKIDDTTVFLLYILSFAIPLAGFIVGAIYATKEDEHYKFVGKNCLLFSLMNIILCLVVTASLFT